VKIVGNMACMCAFPSILYPYLFGRFRTGAT